MPIKLLWQPTQHHVKKYFLIYLVTFNSLVMLVDANWFHNLSDCIDKYNSYTSTSPAVALDRDTLVRDRLEGSDGDMLQHRLSMESSKKRDGRFLVSIPLDSEYSPHLSPRLMYF